MLTTFDGSLLTCVMNTLPMDRTAALYIARFAADFIVVNNCISPDSPPTVVRRYFLLRIQVHR